jgi:hypothetical protein
MKTAFVIAATAAVLVTAETSARVKELWIVLKWNPNVKPATTALDTTGGLRSFAVAPPEDRRDKGEQVGENVEQKVAVPVYTKSNVPAFVRDNLTAQLKRTGFNVEAGESSELTLRSEIVEFWVSEKDHYDASVRLHMTLTDATGKALWSGVLAGTSNNFGRSLKADNYNEAFSNSILELAGRLAGSPGLREALAKGR